MFYIYIYICDIQRLTLRVLGLASSEPHTAGSLQLTTRSSTPKNLSQLLQPHALMGNPKNKVKTSSMTWAICIHSDVFSTCRSVLNLFATSWKPSPLRLSKDGLWCFCAMGTQKHNPTFIGSKTCLTPLCPLSAWEWTAGSHSRIKFQEQVKSVASRTCWKTPVGVE